MSDEYFFGCTLSSTNKEYKWEPDELKENGTSAEDISLSAKGEHCLVLKQALLVGATDGELNIVEVETSGYKNNVTIPIVSLVGGKQNHQLLELSLPDPPVVIKLVQGSGPVHIVGNHAIHTEHYQEDDEDDEDDFGIDEEIDEDDDEEEAEAEVEVEEKPKGKGGKKRNNSGAASAQPSKKKKGAKDDA